MNRPTTVRYQAVGWLTVAAVLAYLCRNAIGVAESTIRDELALTKSQSGFFLGAFFWTYAAFQVPTGWLSERTGTRISLFLFAIGWSLATLLMGVAPGFWLLIVAQLIMGIAQAGIFPASCNSVGHWMPLSRRSLSCGILAAGMQLGAIVAAILTVELLEDFGWRKVFLWYSVPGIVWALCFLKLFRDRPEQDSRVNEAERQLIQGDHTAEPDVPSSESAGLLIVLREFGVILQSPSMWWLCGQQVCRAAGYMFFASWFPTFLQETRDISVKDSGYLQAGVMAGTLLGSLYGGVMTDWIWNRTGNMKLSRNGMGMFFLGSCGVLILGAWNVQDVTIAVSLLIAGAFLAAVAGPCALAATIDIGGSRVPQVFGLMNMTGNLAAAACPYLVGRLVDVTGNWNLVLGLFALIYLTGATCWLFVNPARPIAFADTATSDMN